MKQLNFTLKINGKIIGQLTTTPKELIRLGYRFKVGSFHKVINNESILSAVLS